MAISSSSSSDNGVPSCSKACSKAYFQLQTQYDTLTENLRTFMPPKPDLVFHTHPSDKNKYLAFNVQLSPAKPAEDLSHTNRPSAPFIEEWVSNSEEDSKTTAPQIAHSSVQSTKQVTPPRHSIQPVEAPIPTTTPKPTSPKTSSS
nr:hypothetical protein [Tanacetum cinerariifolium]